MGPDCGIGKVQWKDELRNEDRSEGLLHNRATRTNECHDNHGQREVLCCTVRRLPTVSARLPGFTSSQLTIANRDLTSSPNLGTIKTGAGRCRRRCIVECNDRMQRQKTP